MNTNEKTIRPHQRQTTLCCCGHGRHGLSDNDCSRRFVSSPLSLSGKDHPKISCIIKSHRCGWLGSEPKNSGYDSFSKVILHGLEMKQPGYQGKLAVITEQKKVYSRYRKNHHEASKQVDPFLARPHTNVRGMNWTSMSLFNQQIRYGCRDSGWSWLLPSNYLSQAFFPYTGW